jgi:hypothetical protein
MLLLPSVHNVLSPRERDLCQAAQLTCLLSFSSSDRGALGAPFLLRGPTTCCYKARQTVLNLAFSFLMRKTKDLRLPHLNFCLLCCLLPQFSLLSLRVVVQGLPAQFDSPGGWWARFLLPLSATSRPECKRK